MNPYFEITKDGAPVRLAKKLPFLLPWLKAIGYRGAVRIDVKEDDGVSSGDYSYDTNVITVYDAGIHPPTLAHEIFHLACHHHRKAVMAWMDRGCVIDRSKPLSDYFDDASLEAYFEQYHEEGTDVKIAGAMIWEEVYAFEFMRVFEVACLLRTAKPEKIKAFLAELPAPFVCQPEEEPSLAA